MADHPMAQSVAQTKGSVLIPTVKFLRSRRDEARALLPADLHKYLEQRILAANWYPEADFVTLLRVLVSMLPGQSRETWEMVGEQAAESHFAGAYQPFIQRGTRRVVESFDALWHLQHDTGRWEIVLDQDSAEARLTGFSFGSTGYGHLMSGYFRRILAISGARSSACSLVHCDATSGHWRLQWAP
jgi:hypothetical protein